MAAIGIDQKIKKWVKNGLILSLACLVLLIILGIALSGKEEDEDKKLSAPQPRAAVAEAKKPTIIWSRWKEVILADDWSEFQDTPTRWDRVVPPKRGKVEVLFENGAYHQLKGDDTDEQYTAINIQTDGRFRLKGTPGAKATIWIGKEV